MSKLVEVPGMGVVEFPDDMADEAIGAALAQSVPKPPRDIPLHETAIAHAAQGLSLGAAPKIMGLYAAGGGQRDPDHALSPVESVNRVIDGLIARIRGPGLSDVVKGDSPDQRYQQAKESEKAYLEETRAANPKTAFLSNVAAGAIPSALAASVAPVLKGTGLASRIVNGLSQGGAVGTAYGIGSGENAGDVASSALWGAGAGAAMPVVAEGARRLVQPIASKLGAKAIEYGRKAITGVSSPLARRKPLDEAAVEQAFKVGAIRPLSTVTDVAERLQGPADDLAQRYGDILKELEAKGVTGPNAAKMAADLAQEAQKASANSIIGTRADSLRGASEALATKPTVNPQGDLGLMQGELMKRELQTAAANDFVKEGPQSLAGAARKEIAGRFRQAVEDAVASQASKAPAEAAQFQPVRDELHRTLQALGPAREAAARHARRSPFGLHEAMGLATGIASGNPVEAIGSVGLMNALKERGATTMASAARAGSRFLSSPSGPVPDPEIAALIAALRAPRPQVGFVPAAAEDRTR